MEDFLKTFVLAFLAIGAAAFPEFQRFESHYGGEIIAIEDIVFDKAEQYALITIKPMSNKIVTTINLHDFNTSYTAIKNNRLRRCNIFKTRHELSEMMDTYASIKRDGFHDIKLTFICTSSEIIPNSESSRFGYKIAEFCKDYEVVFSERKFLSKRKRSVRTMAVASLGCGFCIGNCRSRPF